MILFINIILNYVVDIIYYSNLNKNKTGYRNLVMKIR